MSASESVLPGHIRLILVPNPSFYLEIPLNVIKRLCLKPRKYLVFLGWCIFGDEAELRENQGGQAMSLDGDLDDESVYYFVRPAGGGLSHAIDLDVIKQRTGVRSATTVTRHNFRNALLLRDFCCAWTGTPESNGEGMHIIPYARGSEWLHLIVQNRPGNAHVANINDINDIRNGVFSAVAINRSFDRRRLAILKTPNTILSKTDIPKSPKRPVPAPKDVAFSTKFRYTLQWLAEPHATELNMIYLLVHYHYGAAAVERWGHGADALHRPDLPRPPSPLPVPMGPTKTIHDRTTTIQKRAEASGAGAAGAGNVAAGEASGSGQIRDSEEKGQARWDADDVMLYFWGNSQAAMERHRKKQEEIAQNMEQWRQGVPSLSI